MKVLIFVEESGPESRAAAELVEKVKVDVDNVVSYQWGDEDTGNIASLYDIYTTPAVLITRDDGTFVELWQGQLPTASEIIYRGKNG